MKSVCFCLRLGTKMIQNKTVHRCILLTGTQAAPSNNEHSNNWKQRSYMAAFGLFFREVDAGDRSAEYLLISKIKCETKISEPK